MSLYYKHPHPRMDCRGLRKESLDGYSHLWAGKEESLRHSIPLTILSLLIVKRGGGQRIWERSPLDPFPRLSSWVRLVCFRHRNILKGRTSGRDKKEIDQMSWWPLPQLSQRNKETPFWSIRVIWACGKWSFIWNLNIGKVSLILGNSLKTGHQGTMTIKTGEEDGDQEETFAVNYRDVRNVGLMVGGTFGHGRF